MTSCKLQIFTFALIIATLQYFPLSASQAQEMPKEYREVLDYLGRKGDYKQNVLKVGVPRSDLKVSVAGIEVPTAFGFGGWCAMTKGGKGKDVLMGDLVLLQEEVNPVMSALLDHGLEVTALHNHFFWDRPKVYYMHLHGRGTPAELARELKPALDLIGTVRAAAETQPEPPGNGTQVLTGTLDTARLNGIIGHSGELNGTVYKITIGRNDLKITDMGAPITSRMGLNTWAAFTGGEAKAAVAGDVAMLASEVTPVLKALRSHGLEVVAIHHHMTGTSPMVFFLHYWGVGPAADLASGFRAAIDELGSPGRNMPGKKGGAGRGGE